MSRNLVFFNVEPRLSILIEEYHRILRMPLMSDDGYQQGQQQRGGIDRQSDGHAVFAHAVNLARGLPRLT